MTSYNYTQCFICQEPLSCRNQNNYDDKINVLNRFCVLACRHLGFQFPPPSDIIEPEKTIRNVDNCKENNFIKKKYQSLCDICAPKITEFCELYSQLISLRLRLTEKTGQVVDLIDKGNWKHRNEMTQEFSKTFREKFLKSALENSLNDLPRLNLERSGPLEIQPERQIIDSIEDEDCNDDYDSVFILPDIVENEPEENKNLLLLTETDKVAFDSADGDLGRFEPPPEEIAKSPRNILYLRRKRLSLKCRYCERNFPVRSSLIQHERVHTRETPFKCRFCELAFAQSGTRHIHERLHTGIRPYKCKNCNKRFTTRANCRTHLKTAHKIVDGSSDFIENTEAAEAIPNQDGLEMGQLEPRKCSLCAKSFSRVSDLKLHFRDVHEMHHKKNKAARVYKCNHCDLRFSQSSTRNRHEKTVHSDCDLRPYKCAICGRAFLKVSQCKKHQGLIHKTDNFNIIEDKQILEEINKKQISIRDDDYFRCYLCPNRRFERQTDLETHQEICHGNEKCDDTTSTEQGTADDVNVVKLEVEHLELS